MQSSTLGFNLEDDPVTAEADAGSARMEVERNLTSKLGTESLELLQIAGINLHVMDEVELVGIVLATSGRLHADNAVCRCLDHECFPLHSLCFTVRPAGSGKNFEIIVVLVRNHNSSCSVFAGAALAG